MQGRKETFLHDGYKLTLQERFKNIKKIWVSNRNNKRPGCILS